MWNTMIKCVDTYQNLECYNFVPGNLYEVKSGHLIDGSGIASQSTYESIGEINESFFSRFEVTDNG